MVAWEWDPHADRIVTTDNLAEVYGVPGIAGVEQGFELVHPDDKERHHQAVRQAVATGTGYHSEFRIIRPDSGQIVWLEERGQAVLDAEGEVARLAGVVMDITARKQLEEQQRQFVANITHELRNPLAAIRGYAELMQRRQGYDERALRAVISQTGQLDRLVGDLLDVSRLESGSLQLRPRRLDLAARARESAEEAQAASQRHTIRVEAPDRPVEGSWDPDRLSQVFRNLLGNAVKYSPEGGEIVVTVRELGDDAQVSIRDRGLGIAPEDVSKLFERFYRTGSAAALAQGLGLGLYIAKELVEAHGGRMWVESDGPGQGSTFHFILPLRVEASELVEA
jgi:signal transduction histidine kinase